MRSERRRGSRLPEDPAYWEELAARSVDVAFGSSNAAAASRVPRASVARALAGSHIPRTHRSIRPWWGALSDASFMLAACAVLAVLGGSLLLDERTPPVTTEARAAAESRALMAALAPDDALLASLLEASAGPPSAALLKLVALREGER